MAKALLIEDDEHIAELLALEVQSLGYTLDSAARGQRGLQLAEENEYAFIILDLNLPDMEGVEVCKTIRARDVQTPIIVLTARADDISKVLLIELGADDYLSKPFNPLELKARIKAVLRRVNAGAVSSQASSKVFAYKDLTIDFDKRRVTLRGKPLDLTPREYDILLTLAERPGRPFSRSELSTAAYGYDVTGYDGSVTSHINRLRRKIEENPDEPVYVLTVRGFGYCFNDKE